MKTASRENPIHGVTWPRNRAHGAVGQNRTRSIEWAEKQEKFQPKEMCFFLTSPFIELTRWDEFCMSPSGDTTAYENGIEFNYALPRRVVQRSSALLVL